MKVEERERGREEALHVYLVQDHPFRHVAPVRGRVYVIGNLGSRVCVIDRRLPTCDDVAPCCVRSHVSRHGEENDCVMKKFQGSAVRVETRSL